MEKAMGILQKGLRMLLGMVLVLCLLVGVCLSSAEAVENKRVRVGYFYLPGYHELEADGHLSGYGYDLIQRLKLYNNWRCEYIGYEKQWNDGFAMLERGDIDMITGVRMRADRLDKFDYSSSPIGRSSSVLVVREDDIRYTSGNYSTYHGMRIGALKGSIVNINFAEFAREKGFDYSIHYYDHMPELLDALRAQKTVDAVLTTSMRFMHSERVLDQYDSEYLYAIVKKGNEGLLQEINQAIHKMDYINPMWRQDLYAKYYTPRKGHILPLAHDEFAYRELTNAADRRFRVLVNPDRRPYSYVENGQFKGIFPQLMQEIARRSGIKYEYIPVGSRRAYLEALRKQQADLVLDLPLDNYHAERMGYRLSEPLTSTTLFSVKLRGNTKAPKRLALVKSANEFGGFPDFLPQDAVIHRLDSFDECVQGVLSGKYDATYMFAFQAQDVVGRDATQQLVMAIVPSVKLEYCIGINANESRELGSIINKAVVSVRGDFLEQLMGGYAAVQSKPSLMDEILSNPWAVGTIVFVIVGIIFLITLLHIREKNMEIVSKKNEQLEEQQKLLSRALEQAEASNKAKTVFLNSVSHDIRTPMNAIMGFAKLALEQAVNPVTKRYLEKIIFSGKNLLSLINDVLDMSSIENGKLAVHESPCDLVELLKSIHEMLLPAAKQKEIQLLLDISRVAHSRVFVDQILLQRVLLNFLSNSIKYTNNGGIVHLRGEQKGVAVDGQALYRFQIADNGIGMSKEFMEHLFEPFSRERDTTTSGIQGTGLGMTIAKSIVDLLGGKITVESEVNKGTVIYVDISLKLAEEAEATKEVAVAEVKLEGKHVLLVDDVELNREIAQMMLEKAGAEVTCCVNGQEAVDYMAHAQPGSIDFVLMDLMMPVLDGLEAARMIRRLPDKEIGQTVIIALTANALAETKKEVLEAGMNGMLNKPFDVESLKRVLQEALQRGR